MKYLMCCICLGIITPVFSQLPTSTPFEDSLRQQQLSTLLLYPSQTLFDQVVWGPEGQYLGFNDTGKWLQIDLHRLELEGGIWENPDYGMVVDSQAISSLTDEQAESWKSQTQYAPREFTRSDSTILILTNEAIFHTSLYIKRIGKDFEEILSFSGDCGGLALSPDGKLLAFICENYGVMITHLPTALAIHDSLMAEFENLDLVSQGMRLGEAGKIEAAMEKFQQAYAVDRTDYDACFYLGFGHYNLDQYEEAVSFFEKCMALDSTRFEGYYFYALNQLALEHFTEAIEGFNQALALDEGGATVNIYFFRGLCLIGNGDKTAGCQDLKKAIESGFEEAQTYYDQHCR